MSDQLERVKLSKKQMLKLKEIDERIDQLYALKDKIVSTILEKKGDSIGVMLVEEENLEKPWMRIMLKVK